MDDISELLDKYGMESDPSIVVELTEDNIEHCFRIKFGKDVSIRLHARSMVDLIRKANLSLLDWNVQRMAGDQQ